MSKRQDAVWAVTIGSEVCPECGEEPADKQRPTWWERLRHWMINGTPAPSTLACPDGHEWIHSSQALNIRRRVGGPRWLRIPAELFRVVHSSRSMVPVPLTYLMAGVTGLVLGVVLDLLLGWPWWLVASGFVTLVWLSFLASAFWGPDGTIGDDLLRVIDPDRATARELQRMEEAVESGSLVGFEMTEWEGTRSIGGWGGAPLPDVLTIRHGDPRHDTVWIEVTTRTGKGAIATEEWLNDQLRRELVLSQVRPPQGLSLEELRRSHVEQERRVAETGLLPWRQSSISIDGQPTPASVARLAEQWAAVLGDDDIIVDIVARGLDPEEVKLRRLHTLNDYVDENT